MFDDINLCIISGRVQKDPTVIEINGKYLLKFSLVCNRSYKNKLGGYENNATYIEVQRWYKNKPTFLDKWLKKGARVSITGAYSTTFFTNKENERQKIFFISMETLKILETKKKAELNGNIPAEDKTPEPEEQSFSDTNYDALAFEDSVAGDDIPF